MEKIKEQNNANLSENDFKKGKKNVFKELFSLSFLKDFKWYEWTIIGCMTLAQLLLTIFTETQVGTAIFNYTLSLVGFLYVVFASRCSFWIFILGFYQPIAYGLVCLNAHIYGEMIVNFAYFAPMQIVGIILWLQNYKKQQSTPNANNSVVTVKKLKTKQYYIFVPIIIVSYVALYFILSAINGQRLPYLDALISIMCIVGTMLLTLRYIENWYAYLIVNSVSCFQWLLLTIDGDTTAPYMFILYLAYTLYSVIGLIKWNRYAKQNKQSTTDSKDEKSIN